MVRDQAPEMATGASLWRSGHACGNITQRRGGGTPDDAAYAKAPPPSPYHSLLSVSSHPLLADTPVPVRREVESPPDTAVDRSHEVSAGRLGRAGDRLDCARALHLQRVAHVRVARGPAVNPLGGRARGVREATEAQGMAGSGAAEETEVAAARRGRRRARAIIAGVVSQARGRGGRKGF